jgi:hypothetical protein
MLTRVNLRAALLLALVLAASATAIADTITNFTIVSSVNQQLKSAPTPMEPPIGNLCRRYHPDPIRSAFNIPIDLFVTYGAGFTEASPVLGATASLTGTPETMNGHSHTYEVLSVENGFLEFDFLEPMGHFAGGLVQYSLADIEGYSGFVDTSATALAMDPPTAPDPRPG